MRESTERDLKLVKETLETAEKYEHAANLLSFDLETMCPSAAMEKQGETAAMLSTEAYKLLKSDQFVSAAEALYDDRYGSETEEALCFRDRLLAENLHREYAKVKNISPEKMYEWEVARNKSYADWLAAKTQDNYSLFMPSLARIVEIEREAIELRDEKYPVPYEAMLDNYERGITIADLDEAFGKCKERLLPFLEKIKKSGKKIRTDFLSGKVTDEQQKRMAQYLLETIGYDFTRGAFTTTEHPFTMDLAKDDVRVTTNYRDDSFLSSMFSIVHEGGHAIFGQNQPAEDHDYFVANCMTMGMHESVSRFYENRIGRSKEFIGLIYPAAKEIFPDAMAGVTEKELYEAANIAGPSLIRTEADEFTYTLHIIIRYELEKEIIAGNTPLEDIPRRWDEKYEEYLGIRAPRLSQGVLQDVHWSFGFGYFPTYAIGNMYNAMYYNRMKDEIDFKTAVRAGDFKTINGWMKENVFAEANHLPPKKWIKNITGREFTPDDFLNYLEEKYGELYDL